MTNREAAAYLVVTMKRAGYSLKEIKKVEALMWEAFDFTSEGEVVEQADKIFREA